MQMRVISTYRSDETLFYRFLKAIADEVLAFCFLIFFLTPKCFSFFLTFHSIFNQLSHSNFPCLDPIAPPWPADPAALRRLLAA